MENDHEQTNEDWLRNLPVQSETESFKPAEMVDCPQCARKNAPTRLKCLYCNADLPTAETSAAHVRLSRKLESWEKGFNVILLPDNQNIDAENLRRAAKTLRLEIFDLQRILDARKALPLACAESATEAEIIVKNLNEQGIGTKILSDEKLETDKPPRRLRGIEFFDDKINLILFNVDEIAEVKREDLQLIVFGALFERQIETTQKQQRKKENKILETTELSSDELLIDIYSRADAIGYRIETNGFDFSCLGDEKQMLAAQNMKTLLEKLRAFAPDAKFEADYRALRAELSQIWEVEERKNSKGLKKKSFGQFNLESVTTINNLRQFTRYSRMHKQLL